MKRLDTFLQVVLNEQQVKAAVTVQHRTTPMEDLYKLHKLVDEIKQVRTMIQSGEANISSGTIIPKGFSYRSSTILNNLEDSIMDKIKLVEMPDNWY